MFDLLTIKVQILRKIFCIKDKDMEIRNEKPVNYEK